jgi:hyperosmotically inducible periplasmic protein
MQHRTSFVGLGNRIKRKLTIAASTAFALIGSTAALGDTVSQDLIEARQETQIWTTYALSPYLRASDIKVSVEDSRATLKGKVAEEVNRDLAQQIALGVGGIKSVDNQIVVVADHSPAARTSDRGYGDVVDDATITATVKSKLMWSAHTEGSAINVDTNFGKVTLTGPADTAAAKAFAGRIAMNTRGVNAVDNRLLVASPAKPVAASKTEFSDNWITAKVKSTFIYSSNVDANLITVKTERGIVHLIGKLNSGAERALAIELAQNIRGVKRVDAKLLTI